MPPGIRKGLSRSDHQIASLGRQLLFLRPLGAAADDLDLVGLDGLAAIIELESDVPDEEGPYFIAETVCVQRTLFGEERRNLRSALLVITRDLNDSQERERSSTV